MGKVHSSVEVSKIKLKDKTEVRFNTGENQLLTITDDHLIYLDSEGITRKVFLSDVDTFYTYKIDSGKVIFGSIWISLAAFFLNWLTSHAFGPVGG
ncbi:MAG: hypothetical protein Q8S39_13820 [Ignavibacteria bacterium]|nr:hypothetical protein [Ignavibacteria bacterium]